MPLRLKESQMELFTSLSICNSSFTLVPVETHYLSCHLYSRHVFPLKGLIFPSPLFLFLGLLFCFESPKWSSVLPSLSDASLADHVFPALLVFISHRLKSQILSVPPSTLRIGPADSSRLPPSSSSPTHLIPVIPNLSLFLPTGHCHWTFVRAILCLNGCLPFFFHSSH